MTSSSTALGLTAYLTPLLEKHEAGQLIMYEDLLESWQAASTTLKRASAPPEVQRQIQDLHNSQLEAYEADAQRALEKYCSSVKFPILNNTSMTQEAFVNDMVSRMPDWKITTKNSHLLVLEKRAIAHFQKFKNQQQAVDLTTTTSLDEEEDGEELEDGEDGEEDDDAVVEEPTDEDTPATTSTTTTNKNQRSNSKRGRQSSGRKRQVVSKKRKQQPRPAGNAAK